MLNLSMICSYEMIHIHSYHAESVSRCYFRFLFYSILFHFIIKIIKKIIRRKNCCRFLQHFKFFSGLFKQHICFISVSQHKCTNTSFHPERKIGTGTVILKKILIFLILLSKIFCGKTFPQPSA